MKIVNPLNKNLPIMFYIDADSIAYKGSFAAEIRKYVWVNVDGRKSQTFFRACDANKWMDDEIKGIKVTAEMMGLEVEDITPASEGWTRELEESHRSLEFAIKATQTCINDIVKTCKKASGNNPDMKMLFVLTPSGKKDKDIGGIEDMYQGNRKDKSKPFWIKDCRDYLLNHDDYKTIVAPEGVEADEVVISVQRFGEKGCAVSCDKDLRCIENSWYINLNPNINERMLEFATDLGELYLERNGKVKGLGFKFFCYQVIAGDMCDGYFGLAGYSDKKTYVLLKDCETKEECVQALYNVYRDRAEEGSITKQAAKQGHKATKGMFTYISWDGHLKVLTPLELLNQHAFMAYQRRTGTDNIDMGVYL